MCSYLDTGFSPGLVLLPSGTTLLLGSRGFLHIESTSHALGIELPSLVKQAMAYGLEESRMAVNDNETVAAVSIKAYFDEKP